ncbi:hypothetical protein [Angelakisella massiliensis]|nr:hypothetical protein [Angelakisella massiliensis]
MTAENISSLFILYALCCLPAGLFGSAGRQLFSAKKEETAAALKNKG